MNANLTSARRLLLSGAALAALAPFTAAHAATQDPAATATAAPTNATAGQPDVGIPDIVVTAQRRSESVQNVPIAISAFSEKSLSLQKIDGGTELVRAVPNVTFAKGYFAGFNFQIRGVGTQLGTASGDAGVAIHLNNVPLTTSRFFEAEFYDTQRVEVLRGPQGTLYGRNATGGVVNVVTSTPTGKFEALGNVEIGNYNSHKFKAMINVPLAGDKLAFRLAGSYLSRDGFGHNTYTGNRINDRDLWSTRASLTAKPTEGVEATLMWQHFEESDNRARTGGLICTRDNGPASVGGVSVTNPTIRAYLSQGCANASIYGANANGTPNSLTTIFGYFANAFGLVAGDYYAGKTVSRNLQDTDSLFDPQYKTNNDIYQLRVGIKLTPSLKFESISSYLDDDLFSTRDFTGAVPTVPFNAGFFTPGGRYTDPQLGNFARAGSTDYYKQKSKQWTQEFRVDSSFHGPFNFSLGANYVKYKTLSDYYVLGNVFTLTTKILDTAVFGVPNCTLGAVNCIYIDPAATPDKSGHNYFLSSSPYRLTSKAIFGEIYYNLTPELKVTLGARYTDDKKSQDNLPVRLLTPGSGHGPGAVPVVAVHFKEPTGRVSLDWSPKLAFTDKSLFYAVASRGYKAGGTNPPPSFTPLPPYAPEFINAIEFGTKNTLLDRRMTFNLSAFHYKYKDYQVSEIRDRTQQIQNIGARVKGLELEMAYEPVSKLRFNTAIGLLNTKITKGAFVDPTNFTGGDPSLTLVKGPAGAVCAVNTAALATYLATNPTAAAFVGSSGVCSGLVPGLTPDKNGIKTNLVGRHLPNAPAWTVTVGAQYTADLSSDWTATLRGDYYRQAHSFARTYNTVNDELRGWSNVNATLTFDNNPIGLEMQVFVKNLFNKQPVLNTFLADTITGLSRFGFTSDPRLIGASLTKKF
ncbi:MAG: TonB-dependent receptor [Sphingomicrobium sp.]